VQREQGHGINGLDKTDPTLLILDTSARTRTSNIGPCSLRRISPGAFLQNALFGSSTKAEYSRSAGARGMRSFDWLHLYTAGGVNGGLQLAALRTLPFWLVYVSNHTRTPSD
jgi:hypothetical protein